MMNKNLIIFGVVMILLVIFSGCNELDNQSSGDTSKIKLVSYSVESQKRAIPFGYEKISDGFVYTDDVVRYYIIGTIKNIDNKFIDYVDVTVKFLDKDGNVLGARTDDVNNIASGYSKTFEVSFSDVDYLRYTKGVKFEFKTWTP